MSAVTEPKLTGPWSLTEIEAFATSAVIPLRLSAVSGAGWPVVVSHWFLYEDGAFHCACRPTAKIAQLLRAEPRCGFELAGETPPYFGVRGQGLAQQSQAGGKTLLARLADRYLGPQPTAFKDWLLRDADEELALTIEPVRLMSWDYRSRMAAARD